MAPRSPFPIPEDELEWSFARSSGPGGQKVNKTNTKAVLRWHPGRSSALPAPVKTRFVRRFGSRLTVEGELVLQSQRSRDRSRNEADCRAKLDAMVAEVAAPPRLRRPTKPGRGAVERRLREKRERSGTKRERRPSDED